MGQKFGTRYPYLKRRNNVFYVRFRIPSTLSDRIDMKEICRSLHTSDLKSAKQRTKAAVFWFSQTMAILEDMTSPTRIDLENAAREFFETLQKQIDQPRGFMLDQSGMELNFQLDASEEEISRLDEAITANQYGGLEHELAQLEKHVGQTIHSTDQTFALQLIARARRQSLRYFVHQATEPMSEFKLDDHTFAPDQSTETQNINEAKVPKNRFLRPDITVQRAKDLYLERLASKGVGASRRDESERVLTWMGEVFGETLPIESISKERLRSFRDNIIMLGKGYQGKITRFKDRITNDPNMRLHNDTRSRYWRSIKDLYRWLCSEFDIADLTSELSFDVGKAMPSRVTEPLSAEEINQFLEVPLFSGSLSHKSLLKPGNNIRRRDHWWSGILQLVYGMRGGECNQLLSSDFYFDVDIPHFKIQPGLLPDGRAKSHKDHLKVQALPIPDHLLELGLREFVATRAKSKQRLFHDINLGKDRSSDGQTKFWRRLFNQFGLHKPGRGTHVFRHTVAAHLRAAGCNDNEIALVQGRKPQTVTGNYGVTDQLERKLQIIQKLPYLDDLVEKLGGPYEPKKHV